VPPTIREVSREGYRFRLQAIGAGHFWPGLV
jgi:hypothetical protein